MLGVGVQIRMVDMGIIVHCLLFESIKRVASRLNIVGGSIPLAAVACLVVASS